MIIKECKRCIINSNDDKNLTFDINGVCNYCNYYDFEIKNLGSIEHRTSILNDKILEIKKYGQNKKYDCIVGLSGGLDSSFLVYWLCQNGLRPLVVHLDNGWNSSLAVQNIQNICQKLDLDLHTHVIDWNEFKKLQLAYLKASVVDIEILTDHAIKAIIYKMAKKYKIKYSFSGFNFATEAIMIKGWTYKKSDFSNIKDIAKKFGSITSFKTYPYLQFWKNLYYNLFLKFEVINLLNFLDYNKDASKLILEKEIGWVDHKGKHFESIFTKFYQSYILKEKFKIDKRKVHLSNLICSSQMTKNEALKKIQQPLYSSKEELQNELEFVLKKFNLSNKEFQLIMETKIKSHLDFETDDRYWNIYYKFVKILKVLMLKK